MNPGLCQYTSPDGMTIVNVQPLQGTKTGEGEVLIVDSSGAPRIRSLTWADSGLVIEQAAWSPDSGFFVFSGSSSGGHQPWHSPMFVYSRASSAIYELDKCLPDIAVVDPDFQISSPNLVRVTVTTFSADRGLDEHSRHETYNLSDVVQRCEHEQ